MYKITSKFSHVRIPVEHPGAVVVLAAVGRRVQVKQRGIGVVATDKIRVLQTFDDDPGQAHTADQRD